MSGSSVDLAVTRVQVNAEIVMIQRVCTVAGEAQLKGLIQDHVDRTGAPLPPFSSLVTLNVAHTLQAGRIRVVQGLWPLPSPLE